MSTIPNNYKYEKNKKSISHYMTHQIVVCVVYAIVCELFPFPLRFSISKDATVSAFVVRFFLLRHNFVLMPQYRHITPSTTPNTAIAKIPARNKTINNKKNIKLKFSDDDEEEFIR